MGKKRKASKNTDMVSCDKDTQLEKNSEKTEFDDNNQDDAPEQVDLAVQKKRKVKLKTNNASSSDNEDTGSQVKNKKIKFDDDGSTIDNKVTQNQPNTRNKKKKPETVSQDDEEHVKDEDIDKFCDEIDEEDNEQFENWVKLLEEKLQPKKKTK